MKNTRIIAIDFRRGLTLIYTVYNSFIFVLCVCEEAGLTFVSNHPS
jgi:hypothetical protein